MRSKTFVLKLACMASFLPFFASANNAQAASLDAQIVQLKAERVQAKRQAYIAGSSADQLFGESWSGYQREIFKQEYYQYRVQELDKQIAALEKQKQESQKNK